MANKNKKTQIQQANQRKIKQQQYEAATKKLFIFPCIAVGLSILVLLLFFVHFADVYNTASNSLEFAVNGWTFFVAGLTGTYTSPKLASGFLAVPFYSHAQQWTETVGTVTVIAVFVIVFNLLVQVITIFKKMHSLNVLSAVLSVVSAVLLIVCFAKSIDMNNATIISDYCNNPACEVRSYAIFPALFALGSAAVSAVATVKHLKASSLLK